MKFGQFIEYNMIFFLKNHTRNIVEKLVLNRFLKYQNWAYIWINSLNIYKFAQVEFSPEVFNFVFLTPSGSSLSESFLTSSRFEITQETLKRERKETLEERGRKFWKRQEWKTEILKS